MDNPSILADASLPQDLATCHGMIRELLAAHIQLQKRTEQLEHRLDLLPKRVYGPKSDRIHPDQPSLFDEADLPQPAPALEPPRTEEPTKNRKKGHGRKALPGNLRRETTEIDIPQAEKWAIGGNWVRIGEEISEKLDYKSSSLFVQQPIRPKYVIHFNDGSKDQLKVAELPPDAFPKSKTAPGLIADVIVSKLVDHLPLYRQEQRYARQGVEIARSTLCGWLADTAEVLHPLYQLMKADLILAPNLHTDDTTVPVQDDQLDRRRTGRLWTYLDDRMILYESTPNHYGEWPAAFLKGFQGYLQCDAFSGYNQLFTSGTIIEVACWAHTRRKFVEAEKTAAAWAHEAVARIKLLYAIEDRAKGLTAPARAELRQTEAKLILESFGTWLEKLQKEVLPKSPIGEAVGYELNQWKALNVYITDGRLSIDNNVAERAIKPYAIGRRNWLFFGSDNGGRTLAILSSFTATCLIHEINPWEYLRNVLIRLPITPNEQLRKLLPYNWEKIDS
ncbi:IS66 family transposase [Telmatocola sphagniphila]|uniref:IS66 family transposase n=1 Tax=Telmatocola sphagniphila TaxID=1123043 RepID=A0A8E6B9L8_9BACT|nr:IS66 family transposase [Telmatocola sphagniphila]QVL33917.1 IS66 family transposase [Telmatocola sphagniphila]